MSQLPAMPMWWADFYSKTYRLTRSERLAYIDILAKTWLQNGEPFVDQPKDMARIVGLSERQWLKMRDRLAPFFDLTDGTWRQARLSKEWIFVAKKAAVSRANGSHGGRPTALKKNKSQNPAGSIQGNPEETQTLTTHTHTKKKEETSPIGDAKKTAPRGSRWPAGEGIYPDGRIVPDDWTVEAAMKRPDVDVLAQAESFADFWTAKTGPNATKLDWHATWRVWIRNAKRGPPDMPGHGGLDAYGYDKRLHGNGRA